MILDLFPTRVLLDRLDDDQVLDLATKFAESGEKDWSLLIDNPTIITNIIKKQFGGDYEIVDGWVRSGYSSFDIHCDNHYGNQLVCVVQLYGEEKSGGDLVLYDPTWRNPQFVSDSKQVDATTFKVPFIIGQVIVFPADVWHRVTEYTGSISRVTLNLMIKRVL